MEVTTDLDFLENGEVKLVRYVNRNGGAILFKFMVCS